MAEVDDRSRIELQLTAEVMYSAARNAYAVATDELEWALVSEWQLAAAVATVWARGSS
jgi:hypothetical protein